MVQLLVVTYVWPAPGGGVAMSTWFVRNLIWQAKNCQIASSRPGTWSSMKCRIDVPHLGCTIRRTSWGSPTCRSAGRRARPQVWHINPAFHTWPASFDAGPRSLGRNLTIFSLSGTPWHWRRSGVSWQHRGRKKTDSTSWYQYLGILWVPIKRNLPQNTRKGPWDPPQKDHFSLFHYVKSLKKYTTALRVATTPMRLGLVLKCWYTI